MSEAPRTLTPFDSIGTCMWVLLLPNGHYVYDPKEGSLTGNNREAAHVWFSRERALEVATATPWIGARAKTERARP